MTQSAQKFMYYNKEKNLVDKSWTDNNWRMKVTCILNNLPLILEMCIDCEFYDFILVLTWWTEYWGKEPNDNKNEK